MNKEIIIAIISGIVGLAGGVIAWIQAVRMSHIKADADAALERIRSETNLALENVKADQERRKRAFEVALEESKPVEAALAQAWHDIQSIKEITSKYMSRFRFDENSARQPFNSAGVNLSEGYAKWGTELPESARHAWHKAKGCITLVEELLPSPDHTDDDVLPLPPSTTERLREIRITLTDSQMAIAASRQAIRDTETKKILELM
jgi:hypothetical protein